MQAYTRRPRTLLLGAMATLALCVGGCSHGGDAGQPRFSANVSAALLTAGQPQAALRIADQVLARQPHDPAALVGRGNALYALGQMDAARDAYRAALRHHPDDAAALLGLGRSTLHSDPKGAAAALLAASRLEPDNPFVFNDLGVARDLLKDHLAAQDAYRRAIALNPKADRPRMNLGLSLALSGHPSQAVAMLRAVDPEPAAKPVWRANLAVALALQGDAPDARRLRAMTPGLAQPEAPPPQSPRPGAAFIQLAAVPSPQGVAAEWRRLQARFPQLRGESPTVVTGEVNGRTWWRLRLGGFPGLAGARAACRPFRAAGAACLPVVSPAT